MGSGYVCGGRRLGESDDVAGYGEQGIVLSGCRLRRCVFGWFKHFLCMFLHQIVRQTRVNIGQRCMLIVVCVHLSWRLCFPYFFFYFYSSRSTKVSRTNMVCIVGYCFVAWIHAA